jgi:YD repeat-containing protein
LNSGVPYCSPRTFSYTFDANGNRNSTGYTVGAGNQITNDGTWMYTYDAAGDRTAKANGTGTTWTYTDENGRRPPRGKWAAADAMRGNQGRVLR